MEGLGCNPEGARYGMVAWKMFDLSQVGNTISCKQALDFQLSFGNLAGFGKFTAKKHLAQKYVTLSLL